MLRTISLLLVAITYSHPTSQLDTDSVTSFPAIRLPVVINTGNFQSDYAERRKSGLATPRPAGKLLVLGPIPHKPLGTTGETTTTGAKSSPQPHRSVEEHIEWEIWRSAWDTEIAWWRKWFATEGLDWPEEYKQRMDPSSELSSEIKAHVHNAHEGVVRLLDVGSGPATSVGKKWSGRELEVICADPLAHVYAELFRELQRQPPVLALQVDGEALSASLPENYYDIVHSMNAVDHSYNAPRVLKEMVHVAAPFGIILVLVNENVAVRENYWGLHQWNFEVVPRPASAAPLDERASHVFKWNNGTRAPAAFQLYLWNRRTRLDIEEILEPCAHLEHVEVSEGHREYPARYLHFVFRKTQRWAESSRHGECFLLQETKTNPQKLNRTTNAG
ncbi:hypothetical protein CYMTET_51130 [Cymbomonas tetramitiformis]|uniref:Methyltransferase type 11 domain-containing protein n=1 Tax=Cymbomonas tetramitiformis TaxID=36881 RepID=A0AAE0BN89_9CHLO|nr:hypothetical protein CYMTET_51130 [Cymbomonas tetramitiformis]